MIALLWVMLGGALGAALRFAIGKRFPLTPDSFPWATFSVNAIGCLLIGLLAGYLEKRSVDPGCIRLFWMSGFCGGFTTFSAFSLETFSLWQSDRWPLAMTYVLVSVGVGLLLTWAGWQLIRS